MRHFLSLTMLVALAGAPAVACPPVEDRSSETATLLSKLKSAPSETTARLYSAQLWEIWTDAPDAEAQALLDEGMARRAVYDFAGSIEVLDRLVAYCPDYSEGWNQRAFSKFLSQDFGNALEDLDRALELNPTHVAAMSGKALTLMNLGRTQAAQKVLRDALALNPWLPERAYLVEKPGQEI